MEQEVRSMRSISAVVAPPQDVGGRWEPPERLPCDISSWSRAHGESGVALGRPLHWEYIVLSWSLFFFFEKTSFALSTLSKSSKICYISFLGFYGPFLMVLLHFKAWHHADTLKNGQFLDLSLLNCAEQKELDKVIVLFILKAFFHLQWKF